MSLEWKDVARFAGGPIVELVIDGVEVSSKYMKDATFLIPTAKLLQKVVDMVDKLHLDDKDIKGDLYEYLLSKLATAGTNGQFRTPRHIIKMMAEMMLSNANITKDFKIYDPAFILKFSKSTINSINYKLSA